MGALLSKRVCYALTSKEIFLTVTKEILEKVDTNKKHIGTIYDLLVRISAHNFMTSESLSTCEIHIKGLQARLQVLEEKINQHIQTRQTSCKACQACHSTAEACAQTSCCDEQKPVVL